MPTGFPPVFNCKHRRGVCASVSLCCIILQVFVLKTTTNQLRFTNTSPCPCFKSSELRAISRKKHMVFMVLTGAAAAGSYSLFDLSILYLSADDVIFKVVFHQATLALKNNIDCQLPSEGLTWNGWILHIFTTTSFPNFYYNYQSDRKKV